MNFYSSTLYEIVEKPFQTELGISLELFRAKTSFEVSDHRVDIWSARSIVTYRWIILACLGFRTTQKELNAYFLTVPCIFSMKNENLSFVAHLQFCIMHLNTQSVLGLPSGCKDLVEAVDQRRAFELTAVQDIEIVIWYSQEKMALENWLWLETLQVCKTCGK